MSCSCDVNCTPFLPHILICPHPHFPPPHFLIPTAPHFPASPPPPSHVLTSSFPHSFTAALSHCLPGFCISSLHHLPACYLNTSSTLHFLTSTTAHFPTCSLLLFLFRTSLPRRRTIYSPQERVLHVKPDRVVQKKEPSGTGDEGARFPLPP